MVVVTLSNFIRKSNYPKQKLFKPYTGVLLTKIFFLHLQNYLMFVKKKKKLKERNLLPETKSL